METGYTERVEHHKPTMRLLLALVAWLTLALLVEVATEVIFKGEALWIAAVTSLDVFFVLLFVNFRRLTIRINDEWLQVRFGVVHRRVRLEDVISAERTVAEFSVWAGTGLRFAGASIGFIADYGDAVRVRRSKGWDLVFSTHNPDAVVEALTVAGHNHNNATRL